MRYYNNDTLCLESHEYIKDENGIGIVSRDCYDKQVRRGNIKVFGTHGNKLIEYESLPIIYKSLVDSFYEQYGGVYKYAALQPIRDLIKPDTKATQFFEAYITPVGKLLEKDVKIKYQRQASIMKMIDHVYANKAWLKRELNIDLETFWEMVTKLPQSIKAELPSSVRKLKPKYNEWKANGYESLVSKKYGNTNRLKINGSIENLIMSLYIQHNKPYHTEVLDYYQKFMAGTIKLVDKATGEVFNKEDYMVGGKPISIGKTTVWNIINENKAVVDKVLLSALEYNNRHRPYNSRLTPNYSFSKLSMDDRTMPFKLIGGINVMAYMIQDVASEYIVGRAYTRSKTKDEGKNRDLFKAAMNDMFLLIAGSGFGMPAEIEVEHHISNTFIGKTNEDGSITPDLLTNDYLFQYVTFCNPANPQQKRIEHGFRKIKYSKEKNDLQGFKGRFYSKLDNNRPNEDKARYHYTYEEFIASYEALINDWNNELHTNQNKYEGLTRWQVLQQQQNPNLSKPHLPTLAKHIGLRRPTSINRTECKAFNDTFYLPISQGIHNGSIATAYAIPSKEGIINEVYLYQNDEVYLGTAVRKLKYQDAKIERTEADELIRKQQAKHTSAFDATEKQRVQQLTKIAVVKTQEPIINNTPNTAIAMPFEEEEIVPIDDYKNYESDWEMQAINDL